MQIIQYGRPTAYTSHSPLMTRRKSALDAVLRSWIGQMEVLRRAGKKTVLAESRDPGRCRIGCCRNATNGRILFYHRYEGISFMTTAIDAVRNSPLATELSPAEVQVLGGILTMRELEDGEVLL